jgi:CheY-like chemotaxis protein
MDLVRAKVASFNIIIFVKKEKPIKLLLADDDVVDRELFSEALRLTQIKYLLNQVGGGDEVFTYLQNTEVKPDMIFLDLNMPVKDGRETLRELKASNTFKTIPVIILSTSNSRFDIQQSYEWGASLFLSKPHDFREMIDMLKSLLTLGSKYVWFCD